MPYEPKHPRVSLHADDAPWVASAAAINGQTPKAYIERVLVPIARGIVQTGQPIDRVFFPSPPANPAAAFSISLDSYRVIIQAAQIENLTLRRFAEKHLLPTAKAEAVKWMMRNRPKAA